MLKKIPCEKKSHPKRQIPLLSYSEKNWGGVLLIQATRKHLKILSQYPSPPKKNDRGKGKRENNKINQEIFGGIGDYKRIYSVNYGLSNFL